MTITSELPGKTRQPGLTAVWVLVIGIVFGVLATFSGRWAAEGLGGTYDVRAVVTVHDSKTSEGQNGPHTTYHVEALTEDGRAVELPSGEEFGLARPVVVRFSSLTDRVLSVRGTNGVVEAHHPAVKIVAMVAATVGAALALIPLVLGFRLRTADSLTVPRASASFLVGAVLAGYVVLAPAGFGGTAYLSTTDPVPNVWNYRREAWGPPPVVDRGQAVRDQDLTLRALEVRPGAPAGSAPWLSGFAVLTVRIEAANLGDTPLALSADEHGAPSRADGCAGAPEALDGTSGLVCFAVPPGYQPKYLVVGELDREVLLKL